MSVEVICSSFSKNSVVPDLAMVPRLTSRSCFVIPEEGGRLAGKGGEGVGQEEREGNETGKEGREGEGWAADHWHE